MPPAWKKRLWPSRGKTHHYPPRPPARNPSDVQASNKTLDWGEPQARVLTAGHAAACNAVVETTRHGITAQLTPALLKSDSWAPIPCTVCVHVVLSNPAPRGPGGPGGPTGPIAPVGPGFPTGPAGPDGPVGPEGPSLPRGPGGPVSLREKTFVPLFCGKTIKSLRGSQVQAVFFAPRHFGHFSLNSVKTHYNGIYYSVRLWTLWPNWLSFFSFVDANKIRSAAKPGPKKTNPGLRIVGLLYSRKTKKPQPTETNESAPIISQKVEWGFLSGLASFYHWSVTSGLRRPSPLACAVGHTGTFAVNAALVFIVNAEPIAAQRVDLVLALINTDFEAGQAVVPFHFTQVFDKSRPGIEPSLPASKARDQLTVTKCSATHGNSFFWKTCDELYMCFIFT